MKELEQLGFTKYEQKLYTTLLKHGSLTGGDACKFSNVPHGRTYQVLNDLAQKGFVSVLPVKPKIFKPVDPEIAIKELIDERIEGLKNLEEYLPEKLKNLEKTRVKDTEIHEKITIVVGKKNMLRIIENSIRKSENYLKSMFTYEVEPHSIVYTQEQAIKRGVEIRHIATKMTANGFEMMKKDVKRGIKVRYYPVEELRITVRDGIDSFETMVNPKRPKERITVIVDSLELTNALENYFDTIWEKAKPVKKIKQKDILIE